VASDRGVNGLMGLRALLLIVSLGMLTFARAAESGDFDRRSRELIASPAFQAAVQAFDRDYDRFVAELISLTEIPAPPFGEKARGEAFAQLLRAAGFKDVQTDAEGNVLALRAGRGAAPLLAVAAHLDTVFPLETNVKVKRVGTTLRAPGVGDDGRGLAFLLAAARALNAAGLQTAGDVLFVGNVGEEGPGDLRGIRHLFKAEPWAGRIKRFITVDGLSNDLVTNSALGSVRYRVTFKGPGGHSWSAFGQVNPAFALGDAMARLGRLQVPKQPRVSYNVGVIAGGTSVNSIPNEVSMEVDMRSVSPAELAKIDAQLKDIVRDAVAAENAARSTQFGAITADLKRIGERPSGTLTPDSPVLQQVTATMKAFDKVPVWQASSTDANIPISLGIPAFAMAPLSGDRTGRAHSLDEWTDIEKTTAVKDFSLALAILLTVADLP
jgi:tripeptide aminopeptidase